MDLTATAAEQAFRDELRAWLDQHHPGPVPAEEQARQEFGVRWLRELAGGGWAGVHWPAEHGGRGATVTESAIFFEELGRSGASLPANILGLILAGPTIMVWGTEEQKGRLLAPILSGDEIWCQGFSEPGSGSDLASVRTRAEQLPDGTWSLTGQKVWTTDAQFAQWCLVLARTDPNSKRHRGLSYFLLDMEQPGVTVRPLSQITGEAEFNEVFLERAIVASDMMLGAPGDGWRVAMTTLMNERAGLASFLQINLRRQVDRLLASAADTGQLDDAHVAARMGELHARAELVRLLGYRGLSGVEKHGQPGPEGSLVKWLWSESNQETAQLAIELLGPDAITDGSDWAYELLRARGNSIEGGTTEIQKNIIADRVLGLPKGR
jgi:alkylation response protein AidB-like acyl-CoA dehydrogenase